ncbi:hypothetical protein C2W62_05405 [Candidatus Entotheonella serta]|nr:hypothetical protein C2W62_05330 [Candidatus Entotheonella serta]PON18945.1 hypothetical protein C2W62_05405 [Candidatus Entotheonella serta]
MVRALAVFTTDIPLILVLEDLHWSDPSTVETLADLARLQEPMALLIIGTHRPAELAGREHPLHKQHIGWLAQAQCEEVALPPLQPEDVTTLVTARLGGAVAETVIDFLYVRSEGNALFLVRFIEHLVRQSLMYQQDGEWQLQGAYEAIASTLPGELRQLLRLQIERLPLEAQGLLEAASVAGQTPTVAAVAAGLQQSLTAVEALSDAVANRTQWIEKLGLETWADGTVSGRYQFRHMLYRQVVYEGLSRGRRLYLHQRIGLRLEVGYHPQIETIASELAHHFTVAEDVPRAVLYRQLAGQKALRRAAYEEAMSHCQRGLELLESATDREGLQQQELDLYMTLGTALLAIKGWGAPEAGQAYERALTLCDRVGASDHLSAVRRRLLMFYMARGETRTALDQAMHLVRETDEHHPSQWLMAHTAVGVVLFYRGDLRRARIHLGQVLTTYHPDHHDVLALQ